MESMGDLMNQEEEKLLALAQAAIAAEKHRYSTDPVYRERLNAERAEKFASLPDAIENVDDEEGEE